MNALALDLGASGGKILSGSFDGRTLTTQEIHRFKNEPILIDGHLCWDVPWIYSNLLDGLRKATPENISSFGVDSFCNDYALLDANDVMIPPVFMYRDHRTEGMLERMDQIIPPEELYQRTGNQRARFNTLVQLVAETKAADHRLERAKSLLFLSDLLNYFLCDVKAAEYTTASVSQLFNRAENHWDSTILRSFGIAQDILPGVIPPSTLLGQVKPEVQNKTGAGLFSVCTVGQHDTASAVGAVPAMEKQFAYISSGTWSLMGIETAEMVLSDAAFQNNFANEGGVGGRNRFLKNCMGLWLMQECRRQFASQGEVYTFEEMDTAAYQAAPFRSIIDSDDPLFFQPGDMIGKIQSKCRLWKQPIPETIGEITRCIQESLALSYRAILEKLEMVVGIDIPCVYIIGGGARSNLLNQFASSAMKKPVKVGPCEAAAIGNLCAQMISAGEMDGWPEARQVIRASYPIVEFLPEPDSGWDDAYSRFHKIQEKTWVNN